MSKTSNEVPVMPRQRYVVCSSCGTFLRARATECEGCGAWTARAKKDLMLRSVGVLGALLAALYIYSVIQGLGATLAPH